jgi:hypothetical protein
VLQIAKKTAKFPLPESVNYQMKDAIIGILHSKPKVVYTFRGNIPQKI